MTDTISYKHELNIAFRPTFENKSKRYYINRLIQPKHISECSNNIIILILMYVKLYKKN